MGVQLEAGAAKLSQRTPGRRDIATAVVRFQHPIRETLKPNLDLRPAESPDPPNFFGRNVIRPRLHDEADVAAGRGLIDEVRRFEVRPIRALARMKQRGPMRLAQESANELVVGGFGFAIIGSRWQLAESDRRRAGFRAAIDTAFPKSLSASKQRFTNQIW